MIAPKVANPILMRLIPVTSPTDTPVVFYNNVVVTEISSVNNARIYYLNSVDGTIYVKGVTDTDATKDKETTMIF